MIPELLSQEPISVVRLKNSPEDLRNARRKLESIPWTWAHFEFHPFVMLLLPLCVFVCVCVRVFSFCVCVWCVKKKQSDGDNENDHCQYGKLNLGDAINWIRIVCLLSRHYQDHFTSLPMLRHPRRRFIRTSAPSISGRTTHIEHPQYNRCVAYCSLHISYMWYNVAIRGVPFFFRVNVSWTHAHTHSSSPHMNSGPWTRWSPYSRLTKMGIYPLNVPRIIYERMASFSASLSLYPKEALLVSNLISTYCEFDIVSTIFVVVPFQAEKKRTTPNAVHTSCCSTPRAIQFALIHFVVGFFSGPDSFH